MSSYKELNETIKKRLKEKGFAKRMINYAQFLELYEPYKKEMDERDFAHILGIKDFSFYSIKSGNNRTQILKAEIIEEAVKEQILDNLKTSGYINKLINYREFLELYEPYKNEMLESEFASILGMSYNSLRYIKRQEDAKTRILKTEIVEDIKEQIINNLKANGYINKSIGYKEFLELYEPYKNLVPEKQFATIIGISMKSYSNMKNNLDKKAKILKTGKIESKLKEKIISDLKAKGYTNKSINYDQFLSLYELYKEKMTEIDFANVLGISANSYSKLKSRKANSKILKTRGVLKEVEEKIRDELIEKGYVNKPITYEEFKKMYEHHKDIMTENDYARILKISYGAYKSMKYAGNRAIILKKSSIEQEKIEKIKEKLIQNGYANKLINYHEFCELYNIYGKELNENEFANLLDLTITGLINLKRSNDAKSKILNSRGVSEERKSKIVDSLKAKGLTNEYINYEQFLELYEPYKNEMVERDFANILGLAFNSFNNIRKTKNAKARILKTEEVSEEFVKKIRHELTIKGYVNKFIEYSEFQEMYKQYKSQMTEMDFAEILYISQDSYYSIKYAREKTLVLKTSEINEEKKKQIYKEFDEKGYSNKKITYEEFIELYSQYKDEMTEWNFAKILNMTLGGFNYMKYQGKKSVILKKEGVSQELKDDIIGKLQELGYDHKTIYYEEFLELYNPYKNEVREKEFSYILGISNYEQMKMKKKNKSVIINLKKQLLERAKYQISIEHREYTRKELEHICEKNDITLYEFLCYMEKVNVTGRYDRVDKLMQREKIYMGKCPIPKEFQEKYGNLLLQKAQQSSEKLGKKYRLLRLKEDIASEALVYVLQNKGDIVKNSEDDEIAIEAIYAFIYYYVKYAYLKNITVKDHISLDRLVCRDAKREKYEIVKTRISKFKNPESIIQTLDNDINNNEIVEQMKHLYEIGMTNTEAIEYIIQKYNITKEELLEILKNEISKKRKIMETKQGKVYLGEEL